MIREVTLVRTVVADLVVDLAVDMDLGMPGMAVDPNDLGRRCNADDARADPDFQTIPAVGACDMSSPHRCHPLSRIRRMQPNRLFRVARLFPKISGRTATFERSGDIFALASRDKCSHPAHRLRGPLEKCESPRDDVAR
jgi:hypothetical protein